MKKDELNLLRTQSKHNDFHRERIMFCIIEGKIKIANENITLSHLEWFESQGWVNNDNSDEFIKKTIRGMFSPSLNKLFAYTGVGFFYDNAIINEIIERLPDLNKLLKLNGNTQICFGPVDKVIAGTEYPQLNLGKVRELIKI